MTSARTSEWFQQNVQNKKLVQSGVASVPEIASLLDRSHLLATAGDGSFLVAATLASPRSTAAGTVELQQGRIGIELLDAHFERVNRVATNATKTIRFLQAVSHLLIANKVPKGTWNKQHGQVGTFGTLALYSRSPT